VSSTNIEILSGKIYAMEGKQTSPLVFFFKLGHKSDIVTSTISGWIRLIIMVCYNTIPYYSSQIT